MDSNAPFAPAAKHLFRHLHDPRALRKNPLVQRFFEDPALGDAGRARERAVLDRIHRLVREGADRCRDADLVAGKDDRALRAHAIVALQCIAQRPIREVAAALGISYAHCYRERASICGRVARYVAEYDEAPALDYFPEVDEFRFLVDRASHRASFGDLVAALHESDELVRVAPFAQQKIEALRMSSSISTQLGNSARAERAHAQAWALWTEHLARDESASRDVARSCIDLMELEFASNEGNTIGVLRAARRAALRLEPIQANAPPHVRVLYVESLFSLGLAFANLGNLEQGCECVTRAEAILSHVRLASPQLRSGIMVEAWRLRNRLLTSSRYWQPSSQRAKALVTAFELAYASGALIGAVRALLGLTEHHAFAGNDDEALRAARSAVLLAKQYPSERVAAHASISVVLPLLTTRYWKEAIQLLPTAAELSFADTYHRDVISYCAALRAFRMREFDGARTLAKAETGQKVYPGIAVRTRLIAAAAAHELRLQREAHSLIDETVATAEEQGSAPILREAYTIAAKITADPRFRVRAREVARLLTA